MSASVIARNTGIRRGRHGACFLSLVMKDILKCFVSGNLLPGEPKQGVVSFAVPDYGILFRCQAEGSRADLEIIAFLSFLRFAEHNIDIFKKKELHIHTDFPVLVFVMNNKTGTGGGIEAVRREARKSAKRLNFKVHLIDSKENRAAGAVGSIPALPVGSDLKIKTFANLSIGKPPENRPDASDI